MPTRFIKESCRSSRNLDRLSDFEERLFWRLLTTADDYGRFLATPELVRASCFPYRAMSVQKVMEALQGLQQQCLVVLYKVSDREYGEFVTFEKHQGKPRSKNSKYPAKLDDSMRADASTCTQVHVDVTGHPNTNTNTNLPLNLKREGSGEGEKRKGKRPISDTDRPTDKHHLLGQQLGVDVGPEWGKFKNYCKAHDKRYADFEAAFRNWIAKAAEMREGKYAMRQV